MSFHEISQTVAMIVLAIIAVFGWAIGRKSARDQFLADRKTDLLVDLIEESREATVLVSDITKLKTTDWETEDYMTALHRIFETDLPIILPDSLETLDKELEELSEHEVDEEELTQEEVEDMVKNVLENYANRLMLEAYLYIGQVRGSIQRTLTELRLLGVSKTLGTAIVEVVNGIGEQYSRLGLAGLLQAAGMTKRLEIPGLGVDDWLKSMNDRLETLGKEAERELKESLSVWRFFGRRAEKA